MFNLSQFKTYILQPCLKDLVLYSEAAENLLIFTCANESHGGTYVHQEKGPALGIYQMEPATYNDLWQNYIIPNNSIYLRMLHAFNIYKMPEEDRLIYDLRFATAMTRLFYERISKPLPEATYIEGIWNYYKTYYNTPSGKANQAEAIKNYQTFLNT